jgi:hypothetical protein
MSIKAEDAAAAAAAEMDELGKRKFFPRVKHLIGNKEWEDVNTVRYNTEQVPYINMSL